MSNSLIDRKKIAVFTGAGISAPSGIPTFRGGNGLWCQYRIEDVATPRAWEQQPEIVLKFYDERRVQAARAEPNAAHRALVELEHQFDVVVITQNVDDLHERAGSTAVIHLHGELRKARSTSDPSLIYDIADAPIKLGDRCALGSQLRPHVVWFGEQILNYSVSMKHIKTASKILVVGTSLDVYPAAGLLEHARYDAEKTIVDLQMSNPPFGFQYVPGSADVVVPRIVQDWIEGNGQASHQSQ